MNFKEFLKKLNSLKKITILPLVLGIMFGAHGAAGAKDKLAGTMKQMELIGAAVENYMADYDKAPEVFSIDELAGILEPRYIDNCPLKDTWGNKLHYAALNIESKEDRRYSQYWIGSGGATGRFEGFLKWMIVPPLNENTTDIIYSDGQFKSIPGQG